MGWNERHALEAEDRPFDLRLRWRPQPFHRHRARAAVAGLSARDREPERVRAKGRGRGPGVPSDAARHARCRGGARPQSPGHRATLDRSLGPGIPRAAGGDAVPAPLVQGHDGREPRRRPGRDPHLGVRRAAGGRKARPSLGVGGARALCVHVGLRSAGAGHRAQADRPLPALRRDGGGRGAGHRAHGDLRLDRARAPAPTRARPGQGAWQSAVRGPVLAVRHHRALFAGVRRTAARLPLPHHDLRLHLL